MLNKIKRFIMSDRAAAYVFVGGLLLFVFLVLGLIPMIGQRNNEMYGGQRIIENVVIYDIQLVPNHGYKNGHNVFHINPNVYNIVTSEGTFEINTDGPYKFDKVIPRLHKGDTLLQIKTMGAKPGPFSETNPSIVYIKFE